ncbi:hypothetical protein ATM99_07415 [Cellulomonas sp. B6]|nr:hypothetical protein ATM99_07415 [Cellulomonas sp. B6]
MQESDASQSRRIRELTSDLGHMRSRLSQASSQTSALRSDLASLRGSIEVRLARLTAAFDAFVELSSLRDQLALVAGPALVRQATRARLVALGSAPGGGPVLDVAEVPEAAGYWLADAVGALSGDPETEAAAAERAARVDRTRTATFLTLAGAVCGRTPLVDRWVGDALGGLDATRPVTRAQRALWVAAVEGHLGETAARAVRDRLGEAVAAVPPTLAQETVDRWELALRRVGGSRDGEADAPALPQARRAAASLAWLRDLVGRGAPPVGGDDIGGADGAEPASTPASAPHPVDDDVQSGADVPSDDPMPSDDPVLAELVDVLRALVDEGAEQERALTTRVAELEAVVAGKDAPGPAWDAPVDDVLTLLGDDALERGDAVGAAAREACGAWLVAVADAYLAEAEVEPPTSLEVTAMGVVLRARPDGPVEGVETALAKARAPQHPRTQQETLLTGGAAAAAVLLWVVWGVDASGARGLYLCLALALSVVAGALVVRRVRRTRDDAARVVRGVDFVQREATRVQDRLVAVREGLVACRDDAREHHAAVMAWYRPWTASAPWTSVPPAGAAPTTEDGPAGA